MKCEAAKIVPKLLNFLQKQHRMEIAQEMLTTIKDDPDLLKKVITVWLCHCNQAPFIEMKASRPKKARQVWLNV